MDSTITERFWHKVSTAPGQGPKGNCWEWRSSSRFVDGYGKFCIDGKNRRAHRVSWEINEGPIPDGEFVLHACDNPPCVRPSHLWLGDHQDNVNDRQFKGRQATGLKIWENRRSYAGTGNPRSKLTEAEVQAIRANELEIPGSLLAEIFYVSTSTISRVRNGQVYCNVTPKQSAHADGIYAGARA